MAVNCPPDKNDLQGNEMASVWQLKGRKILSGRDRHNEETTVPVPHDLQDSREHKEWAILHQL